jgi:hypothetical protein
MNKIVMILIPIVIIGGILSAGFMGLINIPGVTPAKKHAKKDDKAKKDDPPKVAVKSTPTPKYTPAKPKPGSTVTIDPGKGADEVAGVWDEMDTPALLTVMDDWKDADVVPVLLKMDGDKVSELLNAMATTNPQDKLHANRQKRASALSKALQKEASKVVVPADGSATS